MGNVTATADALNETTQFSYDAANRKTSSTDANGALTTWQYDAGGRLRAITDLDHNTTQYAYDAANQQTAVVDPLGNSSTSTCDAVGNRLTTADRDNRQHLRTYDALNRLTGESWLAASGGVTDNALSYTYDAVGNMLTAADHTGAVSYTYDAGNRKLSQTDVFVLTLRYSYDRANRVTTETDSLGGVTTSVYDAAGNLTSRTFSGTGQTPVRVNLAYTVRNELSTVTRYSDVAGTHLVGKTATTYDPTGKTTTIVSRNAAGNSIASYTYSYDAADRVTSLVADGNTNPYIYDATSQLTSDAATSYSYDANGNRTMTGYQTGPDNRIVSDGVFTYSYDHEGNIVEKTKGAGLETWYYIYDERNLLTSVRQTSNGTTNLLTATYTYDVLGRRVQEAKWVAGGSTVTTRFAYDDRQAWAELNSANVIQTRYVVGNAGQQYFARIDASNHVEWLVQDSEGSVRDVLNASGSVIDTLKYGAYGNLTNEMSAANGGRILYTGLTEDRDTGIVFADRRTLLVGIGRWMQEDPITFQAGDADLGRYAGNDPSNATDPTGLYSWSAAIGDLKDVAKSALAVTVLPPLAPVNAYYSYQATGNPLDQKIWASTGDSVISGSENMLKGFGQTIIDYHPITLGYAARGNIGDAVEAAITGKPRSFQPITGPFKTLKGIDEGKTTYQSVLGESALNITIGPL